MFEHTTTYTAVCDRCGYAEITADPGGPLSMWDRVAVKPMVPGMEDFVGTKAYDLCPSCAREAAEWFHSAPPKEEDDGLAEWERELLAQVEDDRPSRCSCVCGCNYKLDGYAVGEDICGACLDNCYEPPSEAYDPNDECSSCARGDHGNTDTDGVEVWCVCCNAVIAP